MAVNIDELQVETQRQQPAEPAEARGGSKSNPQPKRDLRTEMELLRERELRLRAD
jgi:hypothetical protein